MHWTMCLEGGPRRVNHAAVALNDEIYSFGGYYSNEVYDGRQPIDVHVLDTKTCRWRKLPVSTDENDSSISQSNIPYQRYGHAVVVYKNKAYLWGGRNDDFGACSKMYCFDPKTISWSLVPCRGEIPPARDGHSAVVLDDTLYMFGGFEEQSQRYFSLFFPRWRDFHTACIINRKMYVFGGRSDLLSEFHSSQDYYSNALKVLNLETYRWEDPEVTGDLPCGRRSHSACKHLNDLHEFDPGTSCWRLLKPYGSGPSPRRRQCAIVIASRVFLFGGTMLVLPCKSSKAELINNGLSNLSDLHVLDYGLLAIIFCFIFAIFNS
ncbi:unnamed protein product [Thelazia callipaeda]|uniref:Kelch domain-containing protein 10 n=1 Tax=Thelazia callipaeda TaxID=103827 RepID=A0A0N5DAC3_THECL|nr:unnamed protein product [Thelazia callipaeda]